MDANELREKVISEIVRATKARGYGDKVIADAAIRIVAEACAQKCDRNALNYDPQNSQEAALRGEAEARAFSIRTLIPKEPNNG